MIETRRLKNVVILSKPYFSNQVAFIHYQKVKAKNILRMKKAFKMKQNVFFIILKGLSVAKNCLRPESASLNAVRLHI